MLMSDCLSTQAWVYYNPVRINAGIGILRRFPELIADGPALLITTAGFTRRGMTDKIKGQLGKNRVIVYDQVTPNPELDALDRAASQLKDHKIKNIVALGGGSVLDTAKVLAVTLPSGLAEPLNHVLRQGHAHKWSSRIPVIAIPTTAGTGAEVTPFATVWDKSTHKKHSLTGEFVYPVHALLDPELTISLPRNETLYSALDAISHALESLWNRNRTPVSEAYALQALKLANEALPAVLENPDDLDQRARMQNASLLAGLAISQTRTAIAHAISYPLTIRYGVPHGLACGFSLAEIREYCHHHLGDALNSGIVAETMKLLHSLDLGSELTKYNLPGVDRIIGLETLAQDRTGNFPILIDNAGIGEIIVKSMV